MLFKLIEGGVAVLCNNTSGMSDEQYANLNDLTIAEVKISDEVSKKYRNHLKYKWDEKENITIDEASSKKDKDVTTKLRYNRQRDVELEGFVLSNIYLNKSIITEIRSEIDRCRRKNEKFVWIGYNNMGIELFPDEIESILDQGSQKIKEIYFRYRKLKDSL